MQVLQEAARDADGGDGGGSGGEDRGDLPGDPGDRVAGSGGILSALGQFTGRERDVLQQVAAGKSNARPPGPESAPLGAGMPC
ncbi:MAG: hypothetical protein LBI49_14500 [Nocardiopsaceae bacterium]|nr:hypothetical protein [Nocardiopsaceae bacterium]